MPELGDVEGFRRLVTSFEGATIKRVDVLDAGVLRNCTSQEFVHTLLGQRVGRSSRTGKWLMVAVGEQMLLFHFGMTGSLRLGDGDSVDPYDRVVLATDTGELRFRDLRKLRGIYLATSAAEVGQIVGPIGVDASTISLTELPDRLHSGRSTVKAALLDQSRIAGIGNFLSDEILWRAGIDPRTPTANLEGAQWTALHRSLRTVVRSVLRAGHTPRGPRWLTGARWDQPAHCPNCGAELAHGSVAGRSSVWCPECQPSQP